MDFSVPTDAGDRPEVLNSCHMTALNAASGFRVGTNSGAKYLKLNGKIPSSVKRISKLTKRVKSRIHLAYKQLTQRLMPFLARRGPPKPRGAQSRHLSPLGMGTR